MMALIVYIYNILGDREKVGEFTDPLACATFALALHDKIQRDNEKEKYNIKSITIKDENEVDRWKEVVGWQPLFLSWLYPDSW